MLIADAHNDLAQEVAASTATAQAGSQADWRQPLIEGGVNLQVCPISVDLDCVAGDPIEALRRQAEAIGLAAQLDPSGLALILTRESVAEIRAEEKLGLMLAIEDCSAFGRDLDFVEEFHRRGVRMVSLTWNRRNLYADGSAEPRDGGLSRLGRALVDRLVEKEVAIDLAHASEATFFDVLDHAPEARVCVSHAACRAVLDTSRNLSDEQLRALAERGGIMGMMILAFAIDPNRPSLERFCDHVEHAVSVMGGSGVGLGLDPMRRLVELGLEDPAPADSHLGPADRVDGDLDGVSGPEHIPLLVEALRARGLDEATVRAIAGENLVRFLESALPGKEPAPA